MTQASTTTEALAGLQQERSSVSRGFLGAQDVHEKRLQETRWRRLLLWGIIIGCTLLYPAWGQFVMKPRYAAEMRFSVRGAVVSPTSSAASSTPTPVTSLLTNGQQPPTSSVGFVDGFAVNAFIRSRDCMQQLGRRIDLPAALGLSPSASEQALFNAYTQTVASRFDMVEQINVVTVSAFSPDKSRQIAEALLAVTQDFVEREDEVGAKDTLDVSVRELNKAYDAARKTEAQVASWRMTNHDLDPDAESTMVMTLIGQIEQQLATAQVNYEKIRALGNPNHPMLQPAKMQVDALQQQLADARHRLTGNDSSQAARLKTYTLLKADEAFQENNLTANQGFYLQALHDVAIMRRFVGVIARPIAQQTPSSPVLWIMALEGLLAGVILAFLTSLGLNTFHAEQEQASNRRRRESVVTRVAAQ